MNGLVKWLKWRGIVCLTALTPPCRQIMQLASRSYEQPLSTVTRLQLRVHLGLCGACERYLRQLELLHEASGGLAEQAAAMSSTKMAADAKERIKQRLRCERVAPGTGTDNHGEDTCGDS